MADFYKVRIGDVWLTDNGAEDGDACMIEIPEIAALKSEWLGAIETSVNNNPKAFRAPWDGTGLLLNITAFIMEADVNDDICAALNGIDPTSEVIELELEGPFGNFLFGCWPEFPNVVIAPGTFTDTWLDQVTYPLRIVSVITP